MQRKLLTVITEAALERSLITDVKRLGAHGYTITEARGEGHRGVREAGFEKSGNIRLEVVCESAVADKIARHLRDRYYNDYAMILFLQDVTVLRPDKF
jgi:lysyl-tRNA synthetase class I